MLTKIAYIVARLAAAFFMLQTLFFKFTGSQESIYIFETIGMEPWGRWLVGMLELIASALLLVPKTAWAGGILGIGLMTGAIGMHLTLLGIEVYGDGGQLFAYAAIVFVCCLYIVLKNWSVIFKEVLPNLLGKK